MSATPRKIGLLGGSFNPAHDGHVYISQKALEVLALDEVWWLVSPQNPLKSTDGMASFDVRFEGATQFTADHSCIKVSDAESHFGTQYTYDTLKKLTQEQSEDVFVWLMGADNLVQVPKWHNWEGIFKLVPVAVFAREVDGGNLNQCEAAQHFASCKLKGDFASLAEKKAPAWCFVEVPLHPASSTKIRKNCKKQ